MHMRVKTTTLPGQSTALGWAPGQACTVSIDRPEGSGGQGLGFNGGELLAHTDRVAEIPNSLRHGAEVTLREIAVETSRPAPQAPPVEPPAA